MKSYKTLGGGPHFLQKCVPIKTLIASFLQILCVCYYKVTPAVKVVSFLKKKGENQMIKNRGGIENQMKVPRPSEKRLLLNECHQNKRQSVDLRNEML